VIVISEDRRSHRSGVELALLSLQRHVPGAGVTLNCPWADAEFEDWALRAGATAVRRDRVEGLTGWDVKPAILLDHLARGEQEVVWLDADVLTHGDWLRLVRDVPAGTVVGTEETYWGQAQGGTHRTRAWGLEVGRSLPRTVNTAVVRVTPEHVELLEAWRRMLADPEYRRAQSRPWNERPLHHLGDQEVFTALLGAREFADVPLHLLRQGVDIAQCYGPAGWTPGDRVRAVVSGGGLPPLVHAMGRKPWERRREASGALGRARGVWERLHLTTSPYVVAAGAYRDDLPSVPGWLPNGGSGPTRAALLELPLAAVDHGVRAARARLGVGRYRIQE
jgi:hypothetical protein